MTKETQRVAWLVLVSAELIAELMAKAWTWRVSKKHWSDNSYHREGVVSEPKPVATATHAPVEEAPLVLKFGLFVRLLDILDGRSRHDSGDCMALCPKRFPKNMKNLKGKNTTGDKCEHRKHEGPGVEAAEARLGGTGDEPQLLLACRRWLWGAVQNLDGAAAKRHKELQPAARVPGADNQEYEVH